MIRPYTNLTPVLHSWKIKIQNTNTTHKLIKDTLLKILDDNSQSDAQKLESFEKYRQKLLSASHNEGLFWQPNFIWFWKIVSWLANLFIEFTKNPGSKLYTALLKEPDIPEPKLLKSDATIFDNQQTATDLDNDNKFEDALLNHPQQALYHVEYCLWNLTSHYDKHKFDFTLERLFALRFHLELETYNNLLWKLHEIDPARTFNFFYTKYTNEYKQEYALFNGPQAFMFLEIHLMAHTLIEEFVKIDDTPYQHLYNIIYLLTLMAIKQQHGYYISKLAQAWCAKKDGENVLHKIYEEERGALIQSIEATMPAEHRDSLREHQSLMSTTAPSESNVDWCDSPIMFLQELIKNNFQTHNIHPLLFHFARLSLEQLRLDKNIVDKNSSIWDDKGLGHETINSIYQLLNLSELSETTAMDNIESYLLENNTPKPYCFAEKISTQLILEHGICPNIAQESVDDLSERYQDINPEQYSKIISWVSHRLNKQHKNEHDLSSALKNSVATHSQLFFKEVKQQRTSNGQTQINIQPK